MRQFTRQLKELFIGLAAGGVGYLDGHLLNEFAEGVIYRVMNGA